MTAVEWLVAAVFAAAMLLLVAAAQWTPASELDDEGEQ